MASKSNVKLLYLKRNNSKGNVKQTPTNSNLMNSNKQTDLQDAFERQDSMRCGKNQSRKNGNLNKNSKSHYLSSKLVSCQESSKVGEIQQSIQNFNFAEMRPFEDQLIDINHPMVALSPIYQNNLSVISETANYEDQKFIYNSK